MTNESGATSAQPGVSVVLPILNEARYLAATIERILAQNYAGELEIILALGPSKDETNQIAKSLAAENSHIVLVSSPTGRTAAGLNLAIAAARYEIICRIDGHAEISDNYISDAVSVMGQTSAINVGGQMAAVGQSKFEEAVACAMRSPLGVGGARFHVGGEAGPSDTVYLGVFQKSALLAVGGFDERFIRAQDWELNYRLRASGGLIYFDPRLQVTYRPRPSLAKLAKQYYEYGRWRHVVGRTHKGTLNFRYLAPPTALVINFMAIVLGLSLSKFALLPALIYFAALVVGSLKIGSTWSQRLRLPLILATMHMSWGYGYLTSPPNLLNRQLTK